MNKLIVTTPSPEEIHLQRDFDAPRRLVIQAMTTPALIQRWLGGDRAEVTAVQFDFRVGGAYRYDFRVKRDGSTFALFGRILEIADDRLVFTESMEGYPGESVVTSTFTEENGRTRMLVACRYPSQEIRDIVIGTGMADGAGESYDHLERLVRASL